MKKWQIVLHRSPCPHLIQSRWTIFFDFPLPTLITSPCKYPEDMNHVIILPKHDLTLDKNSLYVGQGSSNTLHAQSHYSNHFIFFIYFILSSHHMTIHSYHKHCTIIQQPNRLSNEWSWKIYEYRSSWIPLTHLAPMEINENIKEQLLE